MIKVNIYEVKAHFSEYLSKIEKGECVVVCKRNIPIAEIRPIHLKPKKPRPIGLAKGSFEILPSFFEPLPDEIIESFTTPKS